MDIFGILTMVGGLALFLFGMNAMGQGLEKLSGSRLERILEKMTSNPFKAIMLGALVTAVIQSSSATTVMVVGFVNSGIMRLSQAIGVIMGANIGTTMTSWLLSLTGRQGESIFMQLLKPTSFTPILAIIGIFFIMMSKSSKKKDIGTILMGFAILMFGMETMSSAVAPLADNEQFKSILTMFSNPVLGVIAGAVLTAVIQSSSASVGILQAFAQYLKDENLTPKRRVYVHVTVYEEVGHGGSASVPDGVTEAISVDMGCVGEGVQCTERQVSICAKDSGGPYSYDVVRKLIAAAKREGADYAVDVYPHYGSDVEATLRAGYDIRHGLIGAGVYASHGYERSHRDGALNTLKVIEGYLFE